MQENVERFDFVEQCSTFAGQSRTALTGFYFFIQVADLLNAAGHATFFYIVKDDHFVIVEVDRIDEGIDDLPSEVHVEEVTFAEGPEPCGDFLFGKFNLLLNPKLGQVRFRFDALQFELFHPLTDPGCGFLWCVDQFVDKLIQFVV